VPDVLLARPQDLHRPARHLQCARHRLAHEIDLGAPAEAAAGKVVCIVTSSCDRPAARAAASRIRVGDWLGIQSSSALPVNSAVQFIGSIGV
jgi:hypothetical protein